jgi:hypothetical protein
MIAGWERSAPGNGYPVIEWLTCDVYRTGDIARDN